MVKNKIDLIFPVGYLNFHEKQVFNYQFNRFYSYGYALKSDLIEVSKKIKTVNDWITELTKLSEKAESENRLVNASLYYRAAELFVPRDDSNKLVLYNKFIELFNKAFECDNIERYEISYENGKLPCIKLRRKGDINKGTIVLHGGFDSFIEELYSVIKYFSEKGFDIIAFDGPGQGNAIKKFGLYFDYKWEKPVKSVLDYFNLENVTLIGISMGGWLCLRAAAHEQRVKRVIASSVSFDVFQYTNIFAQQISKMILKHKNFTNKMMVKKMKKDLMYSTYTKNLMYMTGKDTPIEAYDVLLQLTEENLHSNLVKQDVLILTGKKDHYVPFRTHKLQIKALTQANSVTGKVFTEENTQNHCQVGNIGHSLDVIIKWIENI